MSPFQQNAEELSQLIGFVVQKVMAAQQGTCSDSLASALTPQELTLIETLAATGPRTMRSLCESLGLPLSTGTGVVDKLVAKDCVTRHRLSEDRRVVAVALSEAGDAVHRDLKSRHLALSQAMLDVLTEEEQAMLLLLMRKIVRQHSPK